MDRGRRLSLAHLLRLRKKLFMARQETRALQSSASSLTHGRGVLETRTALFPAGPHDVVIRSPKVGGQQVSGTSHATPLARPLRKLGEQTASQPRNRYKRWKQELEAGRVRCRTYSMTVVNHKMLVHMYSSQLPLPSRSSIISAGVPGDVPFSGATAAQHAGKTLSTTARAHLGRHGANGSDYVVAEP
jgi:hypothetical protein